MLSFLNKLLGGLLFSFLLSGCNETYSKQYLLTHPEVLEKEVERCSKRVNASMPDCKQVMEAKEVFVIYLRGREREPVRYGKYILQAQMACVKMNEDMLELDHTLNKLKQEQAPENTIRTTQIKLDSLKAEYKQKSEELALMLAVIGLNSP